jgi:hypothetical protein
MRTHDLAAGFRDVLYVAGTIVLVTVGALLWRAGQPTPGR